MTFLAYIDPGTGSYFVQLLLGALLGVGVTIKLYWKRLRDRLRRKPERE